MGASATNQINQNRINQFKELITTQSDARSVRRALTRLYLQHSRMVLVLPEGVMDFDAEETAGDLYFLGEIITLLDDPE